MSNQLARDLLAQLESQGTAQNRKVYARHGVGENMFGVSFADLEKLRKKIKRNHAAAVELWSTGNHDARILATMIADPSAMSKKDLDAWVKDLDNYVVADAFSKLAAQTSHAADRFQKWSTAKNEWASAAGWNVLGLLAAADSDLPDSFFLDQLGAIASTIHTSKNRVRHSMNMALIAIGARNEKLRKAALAAAERIGPVEVDHGETNCKTPPAGPYIENIWQRKSRKSTSAA